MRAPTSVQNEVPYSTDSLTTGIVHIGVGGFHRAHQAMYIDRLLRQGRASDWAICGAGLMPADVRMRDALAQNGLTYLLAERGADGSVDARRIAAITDYLLAEDDPQAIIERIADPKTKIVSLTITEGGYNVDDVTGEFNLEQPGVARDLAGEDAPRTVFGLVTEGLRLRRDRGAGGLTVMSCDNLPHNGVVAKTAFSSYAAAADPELAGWIEQNVTFPNSMVDRITPATTERERAFVRDELGVEDAWPVVAEDFTQWVLEDDFAAGRPPLEEVGVQIVDDVAPYEKMKLRLLNASHQALAYLGALRGHTFAHEAATDPAIQQFVLEYMAQEARPTLDPVPGIDLDEYCATLISRFSNEAIADTLERLGTDGSDRIAKFVLPVVRDRIAAGEDFGHSAQIIAAWALVTQQAREGKRERLSPDRQTGTVEELFAAAGGDPRKMVESGVIFGDLADSGPFKDAVEQAYRSLQQRHA